MIARLLARLHYVDGRVVDDWTPRTIGKYHKVWEGDANPPITRRFKARSLLGNEYGETFGAEYYELGTRPALSSAEVHARIRENTLRMLGDPEGGAEGE